MKTWFNNLSSRERRLVLIAAISLLILLCWLLLIRPVMVQHQQLNRSIQAQQQALVLMKKQANDVARLRLNQHRLPQNTQQNPQQLIDKSLQTWRLKSNLERMQSQGDNTVGLTLKDAHADRFMRFLADLENKFGMNIASLNIRSDEKTGLANIRMSVEH